MYGSAKGTVALLWSLEGIVCVLKWETQRKGKCVTVLQHFLLVFNILTKLSYFFFKILKCFTQGKDICCVIKVSTFHLQIGHSFGSDFNRKFPLGLSCLSVGFSSPLKKQNQTT